MTIVVDAAFAVDLTASGDGPRLEAAARRVFEEGGLAPATFWFEVASALRGMTLRGLIPPAARALALQRIRMLGVSAEPAVRDIEAVITVSDRFQLTIYDAAYLELALRTNSGLATRDAALTQAALRAGVPLLA